MVSVVAVIALPVYTSLFLNPSISRLLTQKTEEEAVRVATHLTQVVGIGEEGLSHDSLPAGLMEDVMHIQESFNIVKVRIFSPAGEIIFSTDPKDLGERNRKRYFREIVAKGMTHTNVSRKDSRSPEDRIMTADMVETCVPIMKGGKFLGAFEIYYDMPTVMRKLDRLIYRSSVIVLVVTLGLFAAVALSAVKVHRTLIERHGVETELRQHRLHLEEMVRERTAEILKTNEHLQQEIRERREIEKSLQKSEEKYRSLVESTEDSIYLVDRDYRYLFMNRTHLARMNFSDDRFIGQPYGSFHSPQETKEFKEMIDLVFLTGDSVKHEHRSVRDGRYFLRTLSPVRSSDGEISAVTVVSKDITDNKLLEERLHILSLTDELTGLYNRRGFFTLAEQQLKIANRLKKGPVLLSIDLDDLKWINDTFGHVEGDRALKETAHILRESFRDSDVMARIGGDEFVVLQLVDEDSGAAETLTERLQNNLEVFNAKRSVGGG